ncbi:MAG TPA: HXXEE domain-containing protein [Myxococcota bacterium]|nr:HXXEE domain-containing protein [Myxococcota bacterium]
MSEELRSILLGTTGLGVAAAAAMLITVSRGPIEAGRPALRAAAHFAVVATVAQLLHFAEELIAGFHQRFPEQLGLAAWPRSFFISFNLFWLGAWALSSWGLLASRRLAVAALWFLGIAGLANGVVHPLLSIRVGGYFPGLITSPFIGLAGVLLIRRLSSISRRPAETRAS